MAGIFGPGADLAAQAIQQEQQAKAMQWAGLQPGQGLVALAAQAGQMFGGAMEKAAGYEDPRLAKAKLLQEAQAEVDGSGADLMSDPKSYYTAAFKALQSRGLMDEAMQVRALMMDEESTAADIAAKQAQAQAAMAKNMKGRFTQNSKGQVIDSWTGDVIQKGSENYEAASTAAKVYQDYVNGAFGEPGTPEAESRYTEAIGKVNYKRPPTTVSVINKGEGKFLETVGKGMGDQLVSDITVSRDASKIMENVDLINELLDNPDVIAGPGADIRLGFAKLMNIAGADNADTISQTQALLSRLAETTLNAIPDSNLGGGQGFTERDKEFLISAKAGNFNWTPDALRYLNWINAQRARNLIKRRNQTIAALTLRQKENLKAAGVSNTDQMPLPTLPAKPAWNPKKQATKSNITEKVPEGVTPEEWGVMTDEEKAAWR